ncbi:MAG: hypothetical protein IJO37_08575 [Ruminiclostridium sp.]|nr:hypothetical protein [Ruminiclostridium sp.]
MKKKLRTQKQLARRLGIWVVILALATVWTGLFNPHPYLSIRQYEASLSCGKTEMIRKERLDGELHYLTANQNTLLLNVVDFQLLGGWVSDGKASLDLSKEEDLSVDVLRTSSVAEFLTVHYFGTAPKEAASVLIRFPWMEDAEPFEISTFRGEDGRTYFWDWQKVPFYGPEDYNKDYYSEPLVVEALDQNGQVIAACNHPRYYDGSPLT